MISPKNHEFKGPEPARSCRYQSAAELGFSQKKGTMMDWNAIGAIGEIIGALAVFLTLVYLAIQIRQNTKAV